MASQLELSARAALCRQLAKREPENRAFWMAEAENWSRLSNESFRGEPAQKTVMHIGELASAFHKIVVALMVNNNPTVRVKPLGAVPHNFKMTAALTFDEARLALIRAGLPLWKLFFLWNMLADEVEQAISVIVPPDTFPVRKNFDPRPKGE